MKITLSPAKTSDSLDLLTIQKAAFQPLYEYYQDEQSPYLGDETEILQWISHENASCFCIYAGNALCGGITIFKKDEQSYYLARVFIHPDFQGNGIAYNAIIQCEALFPQAKQWSLDFPVDRIQNRKTYEKAGYRDTGKREIINDRLILSIYQKQTNLYKKGRLYDKKHERNRH